MDTAFFGTSTAFVEPPQFEMYDVPRIDPHEKAFWLEQLESEAYKDKQGKNALKTPDGHFCCLGVYCDAKQMPQELKLSTYTLPDGDRERVPAEMTHYDGEQSIIPMSRAIPWAEEQPPACFSYGPGFTGDEDLFIVQPQDGSGYTRAGVRWGLPKLNDEGFTFVQIRDIINYFL